MTLKEFLEMNKNNSLDIYIYDNQGVYLMCQDKKFFLKEDVFLDEVVLSFELDDNDFYIKLDF